eukprot:CAMPEP_0194291366 /NCGR_PEP_ID=MMETSP0169-20130528/43217_1 /TAXON_ID=218684 /ORGANISM="Corethron pennatum, Strain L29A3" /LENGTH=1109 /DNA_ID=CAMNT_0039039229 /DNA_START=247 /DNA_END=3573 /DNA_ORIENTATION=+
MVIRDKASPPNSFPDYRDLPRDLSPSKRNSSFSDFHLVTMGEGVNYSGDLSPIKRRPLNEELMTPGGEGVNNDPSGLAPHSISDVGFYPFAKSSSRPSPTSATASPFTSGTSHRRPRIRTSRSAEKRNSPLIKTANASVSPRTIAKKRRSRQHVRVLFPASVSPASGSHTRRRSRSSPTEGRPGRGEDIREEVPAAASTSSSGESFPSGPRSIAVVTAGHPTAPGACRQRRNPGARATPAGAGAKKRPAAASYLEKRVGISACSSSSDISSGSEKEEEEEEESVDGSVVAELPGRNVGWPYDTLTAARSVDGPSAVGAAAPVLSAISPTPPRRYKSVSAVVDTNADPLSRFRRVSATTSSGIRERPTPARTDSVKDFISTNLSLVSVSTTDTFDTISAWSTDPDDYGLRVPSGSKDWTRGVKRSAVRDRWNRLKQSVSGTSSRTKRQTMKQLPKVSSTRRIGSAQPDTAAGWNDWIKTPDRRQHRNISEIIPVFTLMHIHLRRHFSRQGVSCIASKPDSAAVISTARTPRRRTPSRHSPFPRSDANTRCSSRNLTFLEEHSTIQFENSAFAPVAVPASPRMPGPLPSEPPRAATEEAWTTPPPPWTAAAAPRAGRSPDGAGGRDALARSGRQSCLHPSGRPPRHAVAVTLAFLTCRVPGRAWAGAGAGVSRRGVRRPRCRSSAPASTDAAQDSGRMEVNIHAVDQSDCGSYFLPAVEIVLSPTHVQGGQVATDLDDSICSIGSDDSVNLNELSMLSSFSDKTHMLSLIQVDFVDQQDIMSTAMLEDVLQIIDTKGRVGPNVFSDLSKEYLARKWNGSCRMLLDVDVEDNHDEIQTRAVDATSYGISNFPDTSPIGDEEDVFFMSNYLYNTFPDFESIDPGSSIITASSEVQRPSGLCNMLDPALVNCRMREEPDRGCVGTCNVKPNQSCCDYRETLEDALFTVMGDWSKPVDKVEMHYVQIGEEHTSPTKYIECTIRGMFGYNQAWKDPRGRTFRAPRLCTKEESMRLLRGTGSAGGPDVAPGSSTPCSGLRRRAGSESGAHRNGAGSAELEEAVTFFQIYGFTAQEFYDLPGWKQEEILVAASGALKENIVQEISRSLKIDISFEDDV